MRVGEDMTTHAPGTQKVNSAGQKYSLGRTGHMALPATGLVKKCYLEAGSPREFSANCTNDHYAYTCMHAHTHAQAGSLSHTHTQTHINIP